jgi:hypothetical protein
MLQRQILLIHSCIISKNAEEDSKYTLNTLKLFFV